MTELTPEQKQKLAQNAQNIDESSDARKAAETLRLNLAKEAAAAAAYPLALMQQLADFDPRSTLGNRTVSSLNSFKVWQTEFEKELRLSETAEQEAEADSELENSTVEEDPSINEEEEPVSE